MLSLFADSHAGDVQRFSGLHAANNHAALIDLAHSLKGSAGTVGAIHVVAAATALHSALRSQAKQGEIDRLCAALVDELGGLIRSIREVVG